MYKAHFARHGMHKYNKAPDMAFVLRKMRVRDAQGKKSRFVLRSRAISAKEITRYIERKRAQDPDFEEAPAAAPTPEHIQCLSLPPSPSPEAMQDESMILEEGWTLPYDAVVVVDGPKKRKRSMYQTMQIRNGLVLQRVDPCVRGRARSQNIPILVTAPESFEKYEQLFTNISNYVSGSIDNGTWLISESGQLKATTQSAGFNGICFHAFFRCAIKEFKTPQTNQGRLFASGGFSFLPAMLLEQSPTLLADLLATFLLCSRSGFVGLCAMLQDHIRQLVGIILPERDVWRKICISLCLQDPAHAEVMGRSWRCLLDSFSRSIGRFSNISVACQAQYIAEMCRDDHERGAILMRQLLVDYRQVRERIHDIELYLGGRLADYLELQQKYMEWEDLLQDSLLSARRSGYLSKSREGRLRAGLAQAQFQQGKVRVAEEKYTKLHHSVC